MQAGSQVLKAKVYFQFICSVLQHENKKFEKKKSLKKHRENGVLFD